MDNLPTREQIEVIEHVPSLEMLRDDLNDAIARIEVDLEFRPGDEEWASRARGALAAHNICFGHVSRRLHRLTRSEKPAHGPSVERIEAKAGKATAVASRLSAEAEAKRAAAVVKAQEHKDRLLAFAERTSWLRHFHDAAVRQLPADRVAALADAATARTHRAIKHGLEQAAGGVKLPETPEPSPVDSHEQAADNAQRFEQPPSADERGK